MKITLVNICPEDKQLFNGALKLLVPCLDEPAKSASSLGSDLLNFTLRCFNTIMQSERFPRKGEYLGSHAYSRPLDERPQARPLGKPVGISLEAIVKQAAELRLANDVTLISGETFASTPINETGPEELPDLDI